MTGALPLFLIAGLAAGASAPDPAEPSGAGYRGAEIYRSATLTLDKLTERHKILIDNYVRVRFEGRRNKEKAAARLKTQIETELAKLAPLAYVDLHFGEYVSSAERTAYITFDVVDKKDAAIRLPFRPAPKAVVADPGGLFAAWGEYHELGRSLLAKGVTASERESCPSFYCPWSASTPELAAYEQRFALGASAHRAALLSAAESAAQPAQRAAALYLLSFLPEADAVVGAMMRGLQDPSEQVRAAALNVLSDVALFHKDAFVDVSRLIPVLDYPSCSDRSKAIALLVALADNPTYRPYIASRASPYLLELLKLKQPSQHDLAFTLLSVLSQKSFDRRDYPSWENWATSVSSAAPPAAPQPPPK